MVQASCEKIQYYGVKRDEEAKKDMKPEEALDKIKGQLEQLREEYAEAKRTLEDWFREHEVWLGVDNGIETDGWMNEICWRGLMLGTGLGLFVGGDSLLGR